MTATRGLATALFIGAALSSTAHAGPRGSRSMRCRDVRNQVLRTGRYYADTPDGPVPFYDLFPVDKFVPCAIHQRLFYVQVPTLDSAKCLVGYTCIAN